MSVFSQLAQYSTYYENENAYSTTPSEAVAAAAILAVLLFVGIALVVSYIIHAFLLGRVFKKAGVKQWIAWVPFYNVWKTLQLGNQQGFWAVLAIIPIVGIVASIFIYISMYNIGLKLQKEGWFVLLAIFIPTVWLVWLAFDGSKWDESKVPKTDDILSGPTPPSTPPQATS